MEDTPNIYLFKTSEKQYMYDVNTDKILTVPQCVHDTLTADIRSEGESEEAIQCIKMLKLNGFMKSSRVKEVEHPYTRLLPYYLKNKLHQLILQVTQMCNLRCGYCVYSGAYNNRFHAQKKMTKEIAFKAIDYLFSHSQDNEEVYVSFYGGEPLIEFALIRDCVSYIAKEYFGKKVVYNLTTNGTLLTDEMICFFVQNDVGITFSLDGPANVHDKHRRHIDDRGSFQELMNSALKMKKEFPQYYGKKVTFNTVLDTKNGFSCINDFLLSEDVLSDNLFSASTINDNYTDMKMETSDSFIYEKEYEYFKLLLSKFGKFPKSLVSPLLIAQFEEMFRKCFGSKKIEMKQLPQKYHHGGPCIPGAQRLFVNATGDFFPCEKVSELSEVAKIGDVYTGIDLKKAESVLNIERTMQGVCRKCWAYKNCYICIAASDGLDHISGTLANRHCESVRDTVKNMFMNYCVLKELGYSFDNEREANNI